MSVFGPSYDYEDDTFVITDDLDMEGNRITGLRNPTDSYDAANRRYVNKRIDAKAKELKQELENKLAAVVSGPGGTQPMASDLDMGGNKIIGLADPADSGDAANQGYVSSEIQALARFLNDFTRSADRKFLRADKDNILDGRLDMKQHKIVDLADPTDSYDAVNERYVASRVRALMDQNAQLRRLIQASAGEMDGLTRRVVALEISMRRLTQS